MIYVWYNLFWSNDLSIVEYWFHLLISFVGGGVIVQATPPASDVGGCTPLIPPMIYARDLDNNIQLNLIDTCQSPEETPRRLQHKSPPPHRGRHEHLNNSHPHRTTTSNDNNPQATPKCIWTHLPSATRHPSHRHSGLQTTVIMALPKRTPTTPLGWPNRQRHPYVHEWRRDNNIR